MPGVRFRGYGEEFMLEIPMVVSEDRKGIRSLMTVMIMIEAGNRFSFSLFL